MNPTSAKASASSQTDTGVIAQRQHDVGTGSSSC